MFASKFLRLAIGRTHSKQHEDVSISILKVGNHEEAHDVVYLVLVCVLNKDVNVKGPTFS